MTTETQTRYRHHRQVSYLRDITRHHTEIRLARMLSTTSKIGDDARTFCLPLESTCLVKTGGQSIASAVCSAHCYGYKMRDWGKGVEERAILNMDIARRDDFDLIMIGAIRKSRKRFIKLHGTGDFFSLAYLESWYRIIEECSDVKFWTYTRAWKIRSFRPMLAKLAALPNHKLHLSFDSSDDPGDLPDFPGRHLVYLSLHNEDLPPMEVDIVFPCFIATRYVPRRTMGSRVCPHYSGMEYKPEDCVSCGICLPSPRKKYP